MKQWKVVELDIIIYNYLTHFLSQPQYSMQETFSLAHLQLLHLNNLHKHVKCIFWCQQAFHTISDNMWVGLKIGITIHMLDPVDLCFFHSLSIPNLLARPNVLYAVSNQNVILLSNVNQELEISKIFLIEHHQCLNTFTQDNTLKLENFRFYIFDLLLFLLGHYLAR